LLKTVRPLFRPKSFVPELFHRNRGVSNKVATRLGRGEFFEWDGLVILFNGGFV
jgi:hypothetical protein